MREGQDGAGSDNVAIFKMLYESTTEFLVQTFILAPN